MIATVYFTYRPNTGWRCSDVVKNNRHSKRPGTAWVVKLDDIELAVCAKWKKLPRPGQFTKRPGELVKIKRMLP